MKSIKLITLGLSMLTLTSCGASNPGHVHQYGDLIPGKDSTFFDEGNVAYYYCEECQTYFD